MNSNGCRHPTFVNYIANKLNMRIITSALAFVVAICCGYAQGDFPLTKEQINEMVISHLHTTNTTFDWGDREAHFIWSGLMQSDQIAAVGYKLPTLTNTKIHRTIHEIDVNIAEWQSAKDQLINYIVDETNRIESQQFKKKDLIAFVDNKKLPYFFIRISHLEIIEGLLEMDQLRYLEPAGYTGLEDVNRSGEGCDDYSTTLNTADYSNITPAALLPWNFDDHMIDDAWDKCNQGEGVWVSLMDSGVSDDNPKFNGDFDEGDSAGRTIETNGYYQGDGWDDECGHGSAMAGLIAGPRGYDDTPAGIAYRANLISNRVTNDVIMNATDEINAIGDALTDAGDDTRVGIISMSLGDVFSHGPVEDGVVYAYNLDKIIFAAAGTSTTFTNWYGVIFPADMDETSAVTGAIEGTTFTKCDVCHTGNEVDFTYYMERSSSGNKAVTLTNDDVNSFWQGYVGGSSAATASMAGLTAMVWANNPELTRDQVLSRLVQTSSEYPDKDDDFGWGVINACDAVDSTFSLPCASSLSNEIILEISSITFPEIDDGLFDGTAEWVIIIEGQSYYCEVDVDGDSGNPLLFVNDGVCSAAPIIIDLGTTTCGTAIIDIDVETHEDDGGGSDCDYSSTFDDSQTITVEMVDLGLNTFTQSTSNGDIVFEYFLYCTPTFLAGLLDDGSVCADANLTFTATPAGATSYEFFLDSNTNGVLDPGETLQLGTSDTYTSSTLNENDEMGVLVTDANGCTDISLNTVNHINTVYNGASILSGIESGVADYESDNDIESIQTIDVGATVDYDSKTLIDMQSGFEVKTGAVFEAFIDGCGNQ